MGALPQCDEGHRQSSQKRVACQPIREENPEEEKEGDVKQLRAALCAVFAVCALYSIVETIKAVGAGRPYVSGLLNVLLFTALTVGLALWKKKPPESR